MIKNPIYWAKLKSVVNYQILKVLKNNIISHNVTFFYEHISKSD